MTTLLKLSLFLVCVCLLLDIYTNYKDRNELANLPQKEAHIALLNGNGLTAYIKTNITAESVLSIESGAFVIRYKSVRETYSSPYRYASYRVLLIKEIR